MRKLIGLLLAFAFILPAHAAVQTLQITIGASTTRISTTPLYCSWILFQDNTSADSMRVGDSTTSSTKGTKLLAGGSWQTPVKAAPAMFNLANWWVNGTQNDVIDVTCDQVNY